MPAETTLGFIRDLRDGYGVRVNEDALTSDQWLDRPHDIVQATEMQIAYASMAAYMQFNPSAKLADRLIPTSAVNPNASETQIGLVEAINASYDQESFDPSIHNFLNTNRTVVLADHTIEGVRIEAALDDMQALVEAGDDSPLKADESFNWKIFVDLETGKPIGLGVNGQIMLGLSKLAIGGNPSEAGLTARIPFMEGSIYRVAGRKSKGLTPGEPGNRIRPVTDIKTITMLRSGPYSVNPGVGRRSRAYEYQKLATVYPEEAHVNSMALAEVRELTTRVIEEIAA